MSLKSVNVQEMKDIQDMVCQRTRVVRCNPTVHTYFPSVFLAIFHIPMASMFTYCRYKSI